MDVEDPNLVIYPYKALFERLPNEITVPTFNSCNKCVGSPGMMHDRTFLSKNPRMISQLNVVSNRKLPGPLVCLAYFIDVLSMDVCTTRHWQTSGRLVQELNDCTVC